MENSAFQYTYSAKEQEEIKKIREKYAPATDNQEDQMEKLRRLDSSVTQKGTIVSLVLGIISALVLGAGMSLVMVFDEMLIGIGVGSIGLVGVSLAYPIYARIIQKERKKVAPEIIRLTDELMK